ncbi:MAG: hypothetical protein IJP66_00515 [Kiritimatiellae bacterium]|nr:hypothetical protein [Kiritimatiellia bacterium]
MKEIHGKIDEYLASKGMDRGENTKKDGSSYFVAVGVGTIQAPLDNRGYIGSRVNAFNKAMLDAKAQMVEYLGTSIATETEKAYAEGDFANPPPEAPESNPIADKLKALLVAKLDNALRAEGVDPSEKEAAAAAAKRVLASEQYRKTISTMARSEVVGMQVMCSFEGVPSGKKGQIGVVAIWSPKLGRMAAAMAGGGPLPGGVGKRPIKEQIPSDKNVLLSTFGVQQKIDENGNLVLVSFGQAGAASESPMAANAAYDKARMNAMAALREFAGETVAVAADSLQAESAQDYEDGSSDYEDQSAFSQRIKARADAMNISGIATVKRWEAKHPLTGRTVYGVVCSWSPQQAARAQSMKRSMDAAASGAGAANAPKPVANPNGTIQGQGASADDDAF